MDSAFLPAAASSPTLPVCLLAPPSMPLLGNCFPCVAVDLGKYVLYSSTLSRQARWRTSLVMSFGGAGVSSFLRKTFSTMTTNVILDMIKKRKHEHSITSMHAGIWRMVRWRLSLRKNCCGIVSTFVTFTSTKMKSYWRHFNVNSASHTHNIKSCVILLHQTIFLIDGLGTGKITRKSWLAAPDAGGRLTFCRYWRQRTPQSLRKQKGEGAV